MAELVENLERLERNVFLIAGMGGEIRMFWPGVEPTYIFLNALYASNLWNVSTLGMIIFWTFGMFLNILDFRNIFFPTSSLNVSIYSERLECLKGLNYLQYLECFGMFGPFGMNTCNVSNVWNERFVFSIWTLGMFTMLECCDRWDRWLLLASIVKTRAMWLGRCVECSKLFETFERLQRLDSFSNWFQIPWMKWTVQFSCCFDNIECSELFLVIEIRAALSAGPGWDAWFFLLRRRFALSGRTF